MTIVMLQTPGKSYEDELVNALSEVTLEDTDSNLPEEAKPLWKSMSALQCPFTWRPQDILTLHGTPVYECTSLISRIEEKITEIYDDDYFPWHTFILNLVLCYEYCCNEQIAKAFSKQREIENSLIKASNPNNQIQISILSLNHVVFSSKCFLYFKSKQYNDARQTLQKIQNMVHMDEASMWGIRGAVYMEYGYGGTLTSIGYIERALKINRMNAELHFLLGKALGRIRRVERFNTVPDDREIMSLEKAIDLNRNATYIIFLAQVYREASFWSSASNKDDAQIISRCDEMNDKAMKLYMEALRLRSDCSHVNIRCAQGFMRLPFPYYDVALAKSCINKALSLAPSNAMVHYCAAAYYEHKVKRPKEAKHHYMLSGQYGAYAGQRQVIKLNYKEDNSYDPLPDLKELLDHYQETPFRNETLSHMGSYWYYIKKDFREAMTYWQQIIDVDPDAVKLKEHRNLFKPMKDLINICEIIFNEAQYLLKEKSGTQEEMKYFRQLVEKYLESNPEFGENSPKSPRKAMFEGTGRGRGRDHRGSEGRGSRQRETWRGCRDGTSYRESSRDSDSSGCDDSFNSSQTYPRSRGKVSRGRGYGPGHKAL